MKTKIKKNLPKLVSLQEKTKVNPFRKIKRSNLERRIRYQTDELKSKSGQLKVGAVREKIAEEQILIRIKAMEATQDGIFIIDAKKADFPVIYANSSYQILTGYSKNELIGQNYFLHYGSEADSCIVEEIKQSMDLGKLFHGEMLSFRKNGTKFWSSLRIAPVRDTNGSITHYVGTQTDITLIKDKVLKIDEQREELLHVTRVGKMAEFISSLTHEISQPLTAILSYAQAAHRIIKDRDPQVQEILQYIINDNQRAAEVIRRIRCLFNKSKPAFEPLDFNVLIHDTVTLIMPHITLSNKVIKFDMNKNLPLIHGDRIQLQQVLLNLIYNGLEAMEISRESHELMVRTSLNGQNMIMVEVKDSGIGIPAENMKKLFLHFYTSKPNGLGMGLSISRSIVEAHGGRLDAENNSDGGARFYCTLPIHKKEST